MNKAHDFKLVQNKGEVSSQEFELTQPEIIIGRDKDADLTLSFSAVSRRHAKLSLQRDGYMLEDLGSSNGTFLNDKRVKEKVILKSGDQIRLGQEVTLTFEQNQESSLSAAHDSDMPTLMEKEKGKRAERKTGGTTGNSASKTEATRSRMFLWRAETIGQKLTLGFLVILVLLAIIGVVAYIQLVTVGNDTRAMEDASMLAMSASHLQRLSESALSPVHDYLLTGNPAARERFDKLAAELDGEIAALKGESMGMSGMAMDNATESMMMLPAGQMLLLVEFNTTWMKMRAGAESIFEVSNPVGNQDAIDQLEEMKVFANSMGAYAQSIHIFQMENVTDSQDAADATITRAFVFLVSVVVGSFLIGAFLSRMISQAISQPVKRLTQASSNISLGDLNTKVEVRAGGEIGELAKAIERMRTSLQMIIESLSRES